MNARLRVHAAETKRIEFLFELHAKYTAGLFGEGKKKPIKNKN
jgi:hypothetical protein